MGHIYFLLNRPRVSQVPPPMSGERVHSHPPPGDYPAPLSNSRPPPQGPHKENGPRRPYPPIRPHYGAQPPSRIPGQPPPRGPSYRPPGPPSSGHIRPNYQTSHYPPQQGRIQGEPPRPPRQQTGAFEQYVTRQTDAHPPTDSSKEVYMLLCTYFASLLC